MKMRIDFIIIFLILAQIVTTLLEYGDYSKKC